MESLKSLKKTRASHKTKLTIFKSYLDPLLPCTELNSLQSHELSARLAKIQQMYDHFDSNQIEIENLTEFPDEEVTERKNFECSYFGLLAAAEDLLSRTTSAAAGAASAGQDFASVTGSNVATRSGGPNLKLPTMQLPTFTGRYQNWLEFRDTFTSLIHNNTSISDIQKFHYLKASVKDSAALVIHSIDISSDNYKVAWDVLCERYNNDRMLINNHVHALFHIEQIQKESSISLRNLTDIVNKNLRSLKTMKVPTEHWDLLIIYMAASKLDPITSRDWEQERNLRKEIPTLNDFNLFLRNRADLLESIEKANRQPTRRHSDTTHMRPKTFITNQAMHRQPQRLCPVCKLPHSIYHCSKFKTMPIEIRIEKAKHLKLCLNCLHGGHDERTCKYGSCKICSQRHNSLLHLDHMHKTNTQFNQGECVVLPAMQDRTESHNSIALSAMSFNKCQVLLSTVIVHISDHTGHLHRVRALLDNGSTSNFITHKLQKQLKIPTYSTSISVQGLNNQFSEVTNRCNVTISTLTNSGYKTNINCFVIPQITQLIPSHKVNSFHFNIPSDIHLADPTYNIPAEVQMLLGADLFWQVLQNRRISLGKGKPTLVETTLGWIVSGTVGITNSRNKGINKISSFTQQTVPCNFNHDRDIELDTKLDKFFELESLTTTQQTEPKVESECESIFIKTTVRQPDGRFVVTIPLKNSLECLGESKHLALIRFQSLERKFKRNPVFKQSYIDFMEEYMALGHMSENTNPTHKNISYFLPHQGVIRELQGAHFNLRKWHSNNTQLLNQIVGKNNTDNLVNLSKHEHTKTLGIQWSCKRDTLQFSLQHIEPSKSSISKRSILSTVAQVFDPLGLINPCMLQAKRILQQLWAKGISWDDELPLDIQSQWNNFIQHLAELNHIEIPRRILCNNYISLQLHTFADASNLGFAACSYIKTISSTGDIKVHLALAKSKVAPLRQKLTMPRLELCGALLAMQLAKQLKKALHLKFHSEYFWSDSTIVLGWIKTCSHQRLKQFVYNRVVEITRDSEPSSWYYVPSSINPADIGSRGLNALQLKKSALWWTGPPFLGEVELNIPTQPPYVHIDNLPEVKVHISQTEFQKECFTNKYSNFNKLQRITALLYRFIHNCKNIKNKFTGPLLTSELNCATKTLCKVIQRDEFSKQYFLLNSNRSLSSKDKILSLNPFIQDSIIRVGGRLSNSNYDYNTKHPILLHASHNITRLLVEHYHKILLHPGPQLLLATLRHKFWIINGRHLTRKITRNCFKCRRFSGVTYQPIMGNLPEERLHAEYPFANTAVDYGGPVLILDRKGRGSRLKKAYICIFVCLAVRATHIELVTDLSTQGFLSALNRFIARRGKPTAIWSDNGTNFRGACNELYNFLKHNSDCIISYSAEKEIAFKFSPAYSPHFNGLAEGAVKSVKHILNRVLSLAHLDYEAMNSVLVEIEGILNSRPLTPMSNDPSDLVSLTPAHFLIGRTITMSPASQVQTTASINSLNQYNRIQALKAHFWARYYKEYISELQTRNKWRQTKGQPNLGDLVVIKDDRLPPNRWLLGRVAAVYKGADGINRVADVVTTAGTARRAFNRLCPLPTLERDVPRGATC